MATPLEPWEDGARVAIGTCGSGKSYGIGEDVRAAREHMPIIVVDVACEWTKGPPGTVLARNVNDATKLAKKGRIVVVQPADEELTDLAATVETVFRWAISLRRDDAKKACAGVVVSEAQMVWPNGCRLLPATMRATTQWRHTHTATWIDVQQLAALSTTITGLARETRVHAIGGMHELERIKQIGGKPLLAAVDAVNRHFKAIGGPRSTQPRMRVILDSTRSPPYEPTL